MLNRDQARYLFSREIAPFIIPKEQVVVADPEWSLERALIVLTRKGTNSVPVVNHAGQVEGLISKTGILDFMLQFSKGNDIDLTGLGKHKVKEAMNKNHSGILANSIFSFAFEVLVNCSYIPIINLKGQFVGILTRKVMMEKVIEYFKEEYLQTMENRS
ncbi:CBS domain-containing protein [Paenactinomyces guangxiensis]|uniref:CBS domain-containing protein n=1 Tax=Paenactinomyces guangxiensis TaxID=1490290 RepID=A0A7W2A8A0_9BACL|nr:CBS domain-containing protein [Paenactinomyces guangxiensis]MBA4493593.1 CBS domain-containing protein [Paenactinomyces guangxiensis]MBH8590880.1 CBS domain-containing protein [Paenactinomyces guangxiensis]